MRFAPLAFLFLLSHAPASFAGPPPAFPTDQAAADALSAPDFILREKAARHLWQSGTPALPLLQKLSQGESESALRARAIAENIGLGIAPDTPSDLADLIRSIHAEKDDDKRTPHLSEALRKEGGIQTILSLIQHQSETRPNHWDQIVAASAVTLAENAGPSDEIYRLLVAAVQGDALPAVFSSASAKGQHALAYDILTFSSDPALRPTPERRRRVLEELAKNTPAPDRSPFEILTHRQRPLESRIAHAEKYFGDPGALPAILEKLLGLSPTLNADALTSTLYEQELLPAWIGRYQKLAAAEGAPDHIYLALAQFLRAAGRHRDAYRAAAACSHTDSSVISFALLAGNLEADADPQHQKIPDSLLRSEPQILARLVDPGSPIQFPAFAAKNYRKFLAEAKEEPALAIRFSKAEKLAAVAPDLARELLAGVPFQTIERNRGSMGPYLRAKRILGEEAPVIAYISARFATMTSEFWDDFLEKYFGQKNPLWIMLHIRSRNPLLNRYALFQKTLTEGTSALVANDVLKMFEEYKSATEHVGFASESIDRLALRIRTSLKNNHFPSALKPIRKWGTTHAPDDYRPGLLDPEQLPTDSFDYLRPGETWDIDPEEDQKNVLTSLTPNPFALLRLAAHRLKNDRPSEAARLLALAKWITVSEKFWQHDFHFTRISGAPIAPEIDTLLESALGLQALQSGDLPTARSRFENLCQLGSSDHQLGAALYNHLQKSVSKNDAATFFETRWSQLESILNIAPRDAEVARALATWSESCDNRRQTEAKVYAELADTLESEQAAKKAHLTRFDW